MTINNIARLPFSGFFPAQELTFSVSDTTIKNVFFAIILVCVNLVVML
jgi:hypothetical protein